MTERTDTLNEGPVWRAIGSVGGPMAIGILGVLSVGLADAFFLARYGAEELTAVGFVYPVIVAVSAFSVGLSSGANAALSQARGAGADACEAGRIAFHATVLALGVGLAIGLGLWGLGPVIFAALGAQGAVLDLVLVYLGWWAASFPFLITTMVANSGFRADGDGRTPATMMVTTSVLNIALTPVLVFGLGPAPELGMAGAGIATFAARAGIAGIVLMMAFRRGTIRITARPFDDASASIRRVVSVGLPAAAARAVNPAGMALVTMAVATLGNAAVAGFGTAARVQALAFVPFFALSAGLAPVIGQAWGAQLTDRARQAMRLATGFALAYGAGLGVVLWVFGDALARLMANDGDAAGFMAEYLRVVGWSFAGYGIVVAANAAMTARSQAGWALGLSILRIGLLYVPLAWLGVTLAGFTGILAATVLANALAAWGALIAVRHKALSGPALRPVEAPARVLGKVDRSTAS